MDVWQGVDNYNQFYKSPKEIKKYWQAGSKVEDLYSNRKEFSKSKQLLVKQKM